MKILIITPYFYPENFKINDLVLELESRGHELTILTGQPNYPKGNIFDGYSNWSNWTGRFSKSKVIRVPIFARVSGSFLRLALGNLVVVFFVNLSVMVYEYNFFYFFLCISLWGNVCILYIKVGFKSYFGKVGSFAVNQNVPCGTFIYFEKLD